MPAYFESGICVRQPSWHGQETLLTDYPQDWDEARQLAGLDWEPVEAPLWVQRTVPHGAEVPADACPVEGVTVHASTGDGMTYSRPTEFVVPISTHKAIVRSDTGSHLGTVGKDFTPITHATMGEMVEALLGQPNANIETMVVLKGGRQVAATIMLDEPYVLPGDDSPTLPYLVLLNAHDGSAACKALATQVRVVCANTYQAASLDGERTGRQFTFRHTAKVMDRIAEAREAIAGARDDAAQWVALATELAVLPAPEEATDRFLSEFIPKPAANLVSDRVMANIEEARQTFRLTYDVSPTCAANHGTALGLVHAAVEYLDHARTYRHRDTLIGRQILRPEPLKARAVKLAREACTA